MSFGLPECVGGCSPGLWTVQASDGVWAPPFRLPYSGRINLERRHPRGRPRRLSGAFLMAIVYLCGRGYAVSIADEITQRFGKPISLGAVYASVDRLGEKGLADSVLREPTAARGGNRALL